MDNERIKEGLVGASSAITYIRRMTSVGFGFVEQLTLVIVIEDLRSIPLSRTPQSFSFW